MTAINLMHLKGLAAYDANNDGNYIDVQTVVIYCQFRISGIKILTMLLADVGDECRTNSYTS